MLFYLIQLIDFDYQVYNASNKLIKASYSKLNVYSTFMFKVYLKAKLLVLDYMGKSKTPIFSIGRSGKQLEFSLLSVLFLMTTITDSLALTAMKNQKIWITTRKGRRGKKSIMCIYYDNLVRTFWEICSHILLCLWEINWVPIHTMSFPMCFNASEKHTSNAHALCTVPMLVIGIIHTTCFAEEYAAMRVRKNVAFFPLVLQRILRQLYSVNYAYS